MKNTKKQIPWNFIWAFSLTAGIVLVAGVLFDYYFDLNDDVLMKDILAGAYTGTPAGHNIQMQYPISALISLFYRLFRGADWYGIFLCTCQYGSIGLILWKSLLLTDRSAMKIAQKVLLIAAELLIVIVVLLPHLVFVQYTVTVTMLSACAAFLLLTDAGAAGQDITQTDRRWLSRNDLAACILIWLAYLIRSEMLLLTLPIVGVAVFIRWRMENLHALQHKLLFERYLILGIVILLGIGIGTLMNRAAYSSPQWKEFDRFFDNRTEVYDFQGIPEYGANRSFYDSIGLSEHEQALLENYNFGLDEEIDADCMGKIAQYAAVHNSGKTSMPDKIAQACKGYLYRLHHLGVPQDFEYPQTDAPWNLLTVLLYLAILILYLTESGQEKKWYRLRFLLWLTILFAVRTALWGYILVRGRDPIRITHSLYLMEMSVLGAMLIWKLTAGRFRQGTDRKKVWQVVSGFLMLAILAGCILYLPAQYRMTAQEAKQRSQVNEPYLEMYEYCRKHADNFYFIDVYSSVLYSEKMFADVDNTLENYDIMGGWACKSPLQIQKYAKFGFTDMQQALLQNHVYMIENVSDDISWILDYYGAEGISVKAERVDVTGGTFAVYRLEVVQ